MKNNINYVNQWVVEEDTFNQEWLGKYEAIMAQGNGYLGLRASTEEYYITETRNLFVAGTFNKFSENEVTELPNMPDIVNIQIFIDDERMNLNQGRVTDYSRKMNYETGELQRTFIWENSKGKAVSFKFRRCVSNKRLHFIKQEVIIKPLNDECVVTVVSGIDGRVSNSGAQHFIEKDKRKKESVLQMNLRTTESQIDVTVSTKHDIFVNGDMLKESMELQINRRQILEKVEIRLTSKDVLRIEKTSSVYTARDFDNDHQRAVEDRATQEMLEFDQTYEAFSLEIKEKWSSLYQSANVAIESKDTVDQLLLNFSRYHLLIMTHPLDNRVNIGAKGLSGEGYKGHTFWDTEIFILPYFIYSHPEIANNLIEYRYQILPGAREKAKRNGYLGAQIPWESAWVDDGEVTPLYGDVDIITGAQTKIMTGLIEDHVSGDVVYGLTQYFRVTGQNESLMYKQLVLETALFWTTRSIKNKSNQYEIKDVIGPDEYKEHVDNNTYTNMMAKYNSDIAIGILKDLAKDEYNVLKPFLNNFEQEELLLRLEDFSENLFIHSINSDNLLPQDDTFLSKPNLDIQLYKDSPLVNEIFKKYNLEQVNDYQVSKQADVLLLMTLFFEKFSKEEITANFNYYESRTLHDSSLSLSTHSILASLLDDTELAYEFFRKLITIDLGKEMHSSDQGIHSASMGGIWQAVILGFGGLKYDMEHNELHINPRLPKDWFSLTYQFYYQGTKLEVVVTHDNVEVKNISNNDKTTEFYCHNMKYSVNDKIMI